HRKLNLVFDSAALRVASPSWLGDLDCVANDVQNANRHEFVPVCSCSREILDALNHSRCVLRRLFHHLQITGNLGVHDFRKRELGVSENSGESVVQVMRYARRELSERPKLISLQLSFSFALLQRNVSEERDRPYEALVSIEQG